MRGSSGLHTRSADQRSCHLKQRLPPNYQAFAWRGLSPLPVSWQMCRWLVAANLGAHHELDGVSTERSYVCRDNDVAIGIG